MNPIHQLVMAHGKQAAREMVPWQQRHLVDIAAEILADDAQKIGITYSGFCLTGFPHKRLAEDAAWEKSGHNVSLLNHVQFGNRSSVSLVNGLVWAKYSLTGNA